MSAELTFFLFLLERYAAAKSRTASDVLREWDRADVSDFIFDMYEIYHQEAIENAFADIDSLVATGKPAW